MSNPNPDNMIPTRAAQRARDAGWPNGRPGNRRTGAIKGTRAGTRRGQLPAEKDAHIQQRRARVAQLTLAGLGPSVMLLAINQWLESTAMEAGVDSSEYTISMATLKKDRKANLEESLRECGETAELARQHHLERLMGLWVRAYWDWDTAETGKRNAGMDRLLKIDELRGKYDGSLALAAREAAAEPPSSMTISLVGVNPDDI